MAYICEFCGEQYDDFQAHKMMLCCCGEQLVPADLLEEDDKSGKNNSRKI